MPRITTGAGTEVVAPKQAMISSAALVNGVGLRDYRKPEAWQAECWYYRDTIGELRYAVSWFSNALSRAKIKPARYDAEGVLQPIEEGEEVDVLTAVLGGPGGQSQMLKTMGEHHFVAGEWYIIGRAARPEDDTDAEEVWEVVSSEEVKKRGDKWWIEYGPADKIPLTDADAVFRCWTPHPRRKSQADSPVRAILSTLAEIEALTLHVKAQVRSRLAGAGVMFVPNELSFATPNTDSESTDAAEGIDPFMVALGGTMGASIADPSSPAALVPIIARVPADTIDKIKHLTFWTELDGQTGDMRDRAIRRAALGIDLPPEVLLGTADVNHWGSWQIEESTIKAHIEPALEVIAACVTRILRRVLEDETILCVFDTSALRLRPNRTKEAIDLYDRGEINSSALRRETGFSDADIMEDEEREDWYLRKIAAGSATPEQVEVALQMLGIELQTSLTGEPRETRPDPSIRDLPEVGPPERADVAAADARRAALEATCDAMVYRALERAGNRIKNRSRAKAEGVETAEMHLYVKPQPASLDALLEGAWTALPQLLRGQSLSHRCIEKALDSYVRVLLTEQQQHNPDSMMRFVDAGITAHLRGESVVA